MKKNVTAAGQPKQKKRRTRAGEIWHRLKKNKGSMVGLTVIICLILTAILTTLFVDYNEMIVKMDASQFMQAPSLEHPFGTDNYGRDMFWRTLYGSRYSLIIGIGATAISICCGIFLGAIAGYFGGTVENIIMRAMDIFASIPGILLGMVIVCVLGTNIQNLLLAVSVPSIPAFTRMTRASILTVRGQEYIEAARVIGMSDMRIIFTQIIPNSLSPLIVTASSRIGSCTLSAAGLSFLGFGVPQPTPEWGALISEGRNYFRTAPWLCFFPGLFIIITVLAFNLLGDGLRDALDPKLKR